MTDSTSSTAFSLERVTQELREFEKKHARASGSVNLLAVSKRKPISAILEAMSAGQRSFGENYVDEGVEKIQTIDDSSIDWHFIGAIQSRKCALIAEHFSWVHGVDRLKVATRLSNARPTEAPPLNICLQVNLDGEASKSGIPESEIQELALACSVLPRVKVRGLMAIPAPRNNFNDQREVFARLRNALSSLKNELPELDTLSMGMSADMEAAVAEGATIVRVGTAIFGARDK